MINVHDVHEALIEAPGDQVLEMGADMESLRKSLSARTDVAEAIKDELEQRLCYFAARTRHIAPVIEILQGVVEDVDLRTGSDNDESLEATPFLTAQQPPFAAMLLKRLALARDAADAGEAAQIRDLISTYSRTSPIEIVRHALIDGLRIDAFAHGETEPGYVIPSLDELQELLLAGV